MEILSLIVCSCIPCLRNLVGKWPRLNAVLGLSETSLSNRRHDEPEQQTRPPLAIRNIVRTGLTPSAFSSLGTTPATETAKNSTRNASPRSTSAGPSRPFSQQSATSSRQALAPGPSFPGLGHRASLVDCFLRQLPNEPNEVSNTAMADSLLRRSLTEQDAVNRGWPSSAPTSGTSSVGASRTTSRRRSDALVEVEEVEKEEPGASEPTAQVDLINDQIEDVGGRPPERCDFAGNDEH